MEDLTREHLEQWHNEMGFRRIHRHYVHYVWRIAFRMVNGQKALAEEITQSVFIQVYKGMSHFNFSSKFSTWLYTITYREVLLALKRQKRFWMRETNLFEENYDDTSVENAQTTLENQQEVQRILSKLSITDRFLLISKEVEGLSFQEIALITGKKEGALRTALSRLKKEIQQEVSHETR